MKTKNVKKPSGIPSRNPNPSQRLIRLDRASGRPGMNTATAAGSPEQKTVQPPSTVAHASMPLTTDVPNEGLASQRTRIVAEIDIPTTVSRAWDGFLDLALTCSGSDRLWTMNESAKSSRSLGQTVIAGLILLVAAWVLLHFVIHLVVFVATIVAVVLAIIALIWAVRVLL
jgi:hypothetical protein